MPRRAECTRKIPRATRAEPTDGVTVCVSPVCVCKLSLCFQRVQSPPTPAHVYTTTTR